VRPLRAVAVSAVLAGLRANTTYLVRIAAVNGVGSKTGPGETFSTVA
jgi:hypothetical protein